MDAVETSTIVINEDVNSCKLIFFNMEVLIKFLLSKIALLFSDVFHHSPIHFDFRSAFSLGLASFRHRYKIKAATAKRREGSCKSCWLGLVIWN